MDNKPKTKIPTGYKQSEVGVIPEDWEVKRLGDIADIDSDNLKSNTYPGYQLKYISIEDVERGILKGYTKYSFSDAPSRAKRKIEKSDILFGTVRPNLKSHYYVYEDMQDFICSTGFSVIRTHYDYNPVFIFQQLNGYISDRQISHLIAGSNYPAVSSREVQSLLIPIPKSKSEQTAIATVLSNTDELITSLQKLIAKKKKIKQGAMQELLTGKRRLPQFDTGQGYKQTEVGVIPEDWDTPQLSELCQITTGDKNTQDNKKNGKYPFFVRSQIVERIDSYTYDGEAVLTAGDGVGTGKIFHYINGRFDFHQRVYKMSDFVNIDGKYFFLQFKRLFYDRIMSMTAKSSVDSVRREMITDMKIPVPESQKEQTAIATVLSDMDLEIERLERKLAKYKKIKEGMMQKLLTGQIRVYPVK